MNADELIKTWPGIEKANAEKLFQSPAWRLNVAWGDDTATLMRAEEAWSDTLDVAITLDGEAFTLGIADSPRFPDLHLLWAQRAQLPPEVLLALVEKECGQVLQVLEDATRCELSVKGISCEPVPTAALDFAVCTAEVVAGFKLAVTSALVLEWGRIRNLDVAHPAIRALTRPAWPEFAALDLSQAEEEALAGTGSCLVVPEGSLGAWRVEEPTDDLVHVRGVTPVTLSFAQMADDDWPDVPAPETCDLACVKQTRALARVAWTRLGLQTAVRAL